MVRMIHLTLVGGLVALFFLLIPASILDSLEPNWTWLVLYIIIISVIIIIIIIIIIHQPSTPENLNELG